jgi:CheY-like chemotaxis protein
MRKDAPIYIIDNDQDDQLLTKQICVDLNIEHPILFFNSAEEFLKEFTVDSDVPFIIISDVNLPGIDGFELRTRIIGNEAIRHKSVPFIFWSNKASKKQIQKAYDLSSHGFFIKDNDYEDLKSSFKLIIAYWYKSAQPELE